MAKWMLRQTSANVEALAHQTGFDPVLVRLLAVRGYKEAGEIRSFLCPENGELADPLLFADMDKAIFRIQKALAEKESFVVFGDYDADGIMSTVILLRTFAALGANPSYYIPKRDGEGYGLNNEAISGLAEQGIRLIVACDNGVSAFEQVEYARSLGIDVVIFDHHDITINEAGEQVLPAAYAVVDAKRTDCPYPFKFYCAAALCYRFSQALFASLERDWTQLQADLLPLAALASVCDIVDLVGENRTLVKLGLPAIQKSRNCGLRALLRATDLEKQAEITTYHVGFVLGPCINAAGRMGQVDTATRLFLSDDPTQAALLAEELVELNQQRRKMTEAGTAAVFQLIKERGLEEDKVIVVHSSQITESIAGIIAGRVKEKYYHPTIVIGGEGEILRGSGRSIHGYNIFEGLSEVRDLFPSFGGHPLAAGLSIREQDVDELRFRINENCSLEEDDFQQVYRIDCALDPACVNLNLAKSLQLLEPIGKSNDAPLFAAKGLRLMKLCVLGKTGKTLRWHFRTPRGMLCEAIDFHGKDLLEQYITQNYGPERWQQLCSGSCGKAEESIFLDILYSVSCSCYMGRESAKIEIVSFRPSAMERS